MSKVSKANTNSLIQIVDEIKEIRECEHIAKRDIKTVISNLLEMISDKLVNGEEIKFVGYFKMYIAEKKGYKTTIHIGKKAGKKIKVPTKQLPRIKFSNVLKRKINGEE